MKLSAHELLRLAQDARLHLAQLNLAEPAVQICTAGLARLETILAQPPRIAIMGEVNSGKTSVADILLGAGVLPPSVVANTHVPVLIKYADDVCLDAITQQGRRRLTDEGLDDLPSGLQLKRIEIGLPSIRLLAFEILDTPGGYSPGFGQPDAQIFIWCTVATRAWTESERAHWSQLPLRCRRNALLVATHKDALAQPADIDKVEQRLHRAAADMFRDVVLVTATGSPRPGMRPYLEAPPLDQGADFLLDRIAAWTAEISARRARKAEKIIRHLARLTFHRLMPGPLTPTRRRSSKSGSATAPSCLPALMSSPASAARAVQELLARFAHSVNEARAGQHLAGGAHATAATELAGGRIVSRRLHAALRAFDWRGSDFVAARRLGAMGHARARTLP